MQSVSCAKKNPQLSVVFFTQFRARILDFNVLWLLGKPRVKLYTSSPTSRREDSIVSGGEDIRQDGVIERY